MVDLTALDAANTAMQKDTKAAASVKKFGAEVTKVLHALAAPAPVPSPSPTASTGGLGLYQLASSIQLQSHLMDGTYQGVIVCDLNNGYTTPPSFTDKNIALLAFTSGQHYVYVGAPTSVFVAGQQIDLADPNGFAAKWLNFCKQAGVGAFIDNIGPAPGPAMLTFLKAVYPQFQAAGVKLGGNIQTWAGQSGNYDDGTAWIENVQIYGPYLDLVMLEGYQECTSGPPPVPKLRQRGNDYYNLWDGWQKCIAAAHAACAASVMCVSYTIGLGEQAAIYSRASALLAGLGPNDTFAFVNTHDGGTTPALDSYAPTWTKANPVPVVDPVAGTASL